MRRSISTIVLAHGLFGFGDVLPGILGVLEPFHYFNRLASHLRDVRQLNVFEPQTDPIGSIEQRARQLAEEIKGKKLSDPLHIIAYSMGGLDARFLINNLRDVGGRVTTLVTVGTPHAGSPVADAFVNPTDPLTAEIPPFLLQVLHKNAGAIPDLTTKACEKFNANTPDIDGVRYLEIAGIAPKDGSELLPLSLAAKIGDLHGNNDGVVTVASAQRPRRELFATWPVDHLGEIGWSKATTNLLHPFLMRDALKEHLDRYDTIITAIMPAARVAGAGS